MILLHGFPEFWWTWRRQITPLVQAGFHVIAPDLRGYGGSDKPEGLPAYALDVLAADVAALADALGAPRFRVVAHDWGAVIGWWTAACYPERVERAVLIAGPHPDAWVETVRRHPGQALRSAYMAFFQLPRLPEAMLRAGRFSWMKSALRRSARPGAFEPGALDRYAQAWAQPGALTAMLAYYRALRLRPRGAAPVRIKPPTLVIRGDGDRFLGRAVMEASAALCDDGRLLTIADASHWLHLEREERVNAVVVDFLRE